MPELKITIGKRVSRKQKKTYVEDRTNFLSAEKLKEDVETILTTKTDDF